MGRRSALKRTLCALVAGVSFVGLLLTSPKPAVAAQRLSGLHKDVCDFLHDTEGLDQIDIRNFLGKLFSDGEFDVPSFLFSGSDLVVSYTWCSVQSNDTNPFDQALSNDQSALRKLVKAEA